MPGSLQGRGLHCRFQARQGCRSSAFLLATQSSLFHFAQNKKRPPQTCPTGHTHLPLRCDSLRLLAFIFLCVYRFLHRGCQPSGDHVAAQPQTVAAAHAASYPHTAEPFPAAGLRSKIILSSRAAHIQPPHAHVPAPPALDHLPPSAVPAMSFRHRRQHAKRGYHIWSSS